MNELIQNYQSRQDEKFRKMVENSTVIKSENVPVKKLHLIGNEKRMRSLIFLLITFVYTIITNFIVGEFSMLLLILNLVMFGTDFYLRLNDNSVWALNHYSKISAISIINRFAVTFIFFWTTYMHITELLEIIAVNKEHFDYLIRVSYTPSEGRWECFKIIFDENPVFIISFAYSIITFIPVLFYFIKLSIRYYSKNILTVVAMAIPILGIVVLYKWIMAFKNFKEYVLIDNETCKINHRRLNNNAYVLSKAVLRGAIIVAFIIGYVILMTSIQNM